MTNPAEDPPSPAPSRWIPPLASTVTVKGMPLAQRDDADEAKALLRSDKAEEKPSSPSVPPASREVSEEINVADIAVETKKLEEEAGEAVMSNENEEAEKVVMGMETADSYAACSFGEMTEAAEAWKVEEETLVANTAEDITKAEEEANVANTAEDISKVEEETDVANISEDNKKTEEETDAANMADDNTKMDEETDVANIAEDNKKVEEETDVANMADDKTKVDEETHVANIDEDSTKVEEDADVADIVEGEVDEAAMLYEKEEAEKVVARKELADTYVACSLGETNEVVGIREVDEEADEDGMPDENEEAEKVALGMEMEEGHVASTLGETTEANGAGMEAEDKEEAAEVLNVVGTVEGTTDTEEDAYEAGGWEEALEAEEVEVANEADLMEEEADVAVVAEYTGGAELTEEMEMAEEQGRSVSAKRKRGKSTKSAGRVPIRKKVEEDVCFICFDGGELVLCDRRGCPKAYHPTCVNRDDAFFRAKGKWNCGWHLCSNCGKNSYYMCYTCTFSLCKGCIKDAVILCVRGKNGFCETCMRTVMLIEQNELGNKDKGQVDFDDKGSWEYLFKDYYTDLKEKLSLTCDELAQAKNPWKGTDIHLTKQESPDELYEANNDGGSHSDSSSENVERSSVKRRKANKRLKSRSKEVNSHGTMTLISDKGPSADERSDWASTELLEFVMHMRNGDKSILSQFDVQALLLEYIKRNKLRDPRRKSQIICDARLQNLFGKPRVGHFEMLKLLESHFLLKEDSQAEDQQGSVVDTEVNHLEGDGNIDSYPKTGKDKRRKTRKKSDERGLQSNIDDYAAIDNHNINLIYLRRNLMEELLEDTDKFHDKVVGSFVRIRISGSGQKQDLYRLVQVVGTCKAAEPYKVGKRMTDTLLEILNLNKTEIVSIDIISNQEFTEDECKRLRQSIKCGLINRLRVGDIQDKAMALQAVRVKDWLETEIVRLSHLRDRASEKGRRKELRECVEKLQLLKTPEERQRRLDEIPEIHADPNMDPSYESEEEEEETDLKRPESYMRSRGIAFERRGRETVSPRTGGSNSNDSWSGARNYSNINRELSRNLSNKGLSVKFDDVSNASEALNDGQIPRVRERETQLSNSWEGQKLYSSLESSGKSIQPVVASESLSATVSNASAVSSTGIAPPAVKINESEKMWHYKDPSGKVQGPFSMVQLRKWNNTGYFPVDLRIWRATDKQDESILLTNALAGNFFRESSAVDKTSPKVQVVHNLNYAASHTGKLHVPAQSVDAQVGGRSAFDQSSGSYNSHNAMGSLGQTTGGSWRFEDNNSVANRPSPMTVEIPKIPSNVRGPDAGITIESVNLPSPTPQTTSYGAKGQAFETKWSPTTVHPAGGLRKGRWGAEEDEILTKYVQANGEGSWRSLPKNAGLLRCGKSCRLRWINYLRSDLKRGNITPHEEDLIIQLHSSLGNRWSQIASHLPGRTDNEIKNYWNSHLSRKIYPFRKPASTDQNTTDNTAVTANANNITKRKGGRTSRWAMKKNRSNNTKREVSEKPNHHQNSNVAAVPEPHTPALENEGLPVTLDGKDFEDFMVLEGDNNNTQDKVAEKSEEESGEAVEAVSNDGENGDGWLRSGEDKETREMTTQAEVIHEEGIDGGGELCLDDMLDNWLLEDDRGGVSSLTEERERNDDVSCFDSKEASADHPHAQHWYSGSPMPEDDYWHNWEVNMDDPLMMNHDDNQSHAWDDDKQDLLSWLWEDDDCQGDPHKQNPKLPLILS